jgi:ribosomal protein S18 acetylase RimI-like enzyme
MDMHIRPAAPSSTDATAFARLANMASHDVLADLLGEGFEQVLVSMFLGEGNLYSYPLVHFVEAGDGIAGMLCAFSGQQKADLNAATDRYFLEVPGADSESLTRIQHQFQPISVFIDTLPIEACYIQFLAVFPEARGNGCARSLLAHAEHLARAQGARTLELDVETGNDAALGAYRRSGLEITRTSAEVNYTTQRRKLALHRMVKILD